MFGGLRAAMTWIHTWVGLVAGYLLMVIFFFGTLAVFDREIDRWAIPETRSIAQPMPSWEAVLAPAFAQVEPDAARLAELAKRHGGRPAIRLASAGAYRTHRDPVVALYSELIAEFPDGAKESVEGRETTIVARTGAALPASAFALGTKFFYPMHIHFHLDESAANLGYWLVGVAALGMLVALVSGVVVHRRLVAELFTFRPWMNAQRTTLDLHDVTGVLALPFYLVFALTGLVVFSGIYLPVSETVLRPLAAKHEAREARERGYEAGPAGIAAPLASVDAMVATAERRWADDGWPGEVGYLIVRHPGDRNASVSVYRAGKDRVTMFSTGTHFEGTTGRMLAREPRPGPIASAVSFLTAVHLQPFEQWSLRWLYAAGGISGCVCIATGMIFFVRKRARKHPAGARWADAIAIGTVTGPLLAVTAMLVANRALPPDLAARSPIERALFWATWVASFLHGAWRRGAGGLAPAWREQCWAVSVLALAAVILDGLTTGDHLLRSLFVERYWPVAGVDLALVVTAGLALLAGVRLARPRTEAG